jgi:hypothetical protein
MNILSLVQVIFLQGSPCIKEFLSQNLFPKSLAAPDKRKNSSQKLHKMVELNLIVEEFYRFVDIFGELIRASEIKRPNVKGNSPVNFLSEEESEILRVMAELGQS